MGLKQSTIVFCFPYRDGPGGVNMLFLRLASYLHQRDYKVALVDYPDGDMAKNNTLDIELIVYDDNKKVVLPKDAIIIFQSMTPWSIFPMLKIDPDSQVYFITTLPANFYPVLPGPLRNIMYEGGRLSKLFWRTLLFNEYSKSKSFLKLINHKKSHAILDSNIACNLQNSFQEDISACTYLPLFSDDVLHNEYLCRATDKRSVIKLGWVGRLADFKISILNRVIQDAYEFAGNHNKSIEFSIVGSGEFEEFLICPSSTHFSINKIPYLTPQEINEFVIDLDMLFAMGTSALEGAKLGVPTVRLDYSYSVIPQNYRYKFFHEIKGYCLGERIKGSCFQNGTHSFKDIMTAYSENRLELSRLSFDFYRNNHAITRSAELFVHYLNQSKLRMRDIYKNRMNKSALYSLRTLFK